ncbi:MAG TPA: carbonic anhydrase [Pyrinomonadaceae bacterium]|nr:carbonic anhydrase [Pyrinomonadaceae bacterium]
MLKDTFATAITCIDGRVQRPVTDWVKLHVNVDHVDLITEPGPDKVFSSGPRPVIEDMMRKVAFSVQHHFSKVVIVSGHDTCAANPATREEHVEQIKDSVEKILEYRLNVRVLGLWVSEWGSVELLYDSQPTERTHSFL